MCKRTEGGWVATRDRKPRGHSRTDHLRSCRRACSTWHSQAGIPIPAPPGRPTQDATCPGVAPNTPWHPQNRLPGSQPAPPTSRPPKPSACPSPGHTSTPSTSGVGFQASLGPPGAPQGQGPCLTTTLYPNSWHRGCTDEAPDSPKPHTCQGRWARN